MANPPDRSLWDQFSYDGRKWFFICWHRLSGSTFGWEKIVELAIRALVVVWPLVVAYRNGWPHAMWWLAAYVLALMFIRKRNFSPANMQFNQEGYAERKALLAAAIMLLDEKIRSQNPLPDEDKKRLRGFALDAIVSYVRGHRSDTKRAKIYANLAVVKGDRVVIIHRDSNCKRALSPHGFPRRESLAGSAIETGEMQGSGDIKYHFPSTPSGKPYKSVLVVPILAPESSSESLTVVGALTIDSSEPFHFNTYENTLETNLMPYVRLLGCTL